LAFAARLAVENGAAGIIVSNHGARQLDYVPATISALEEVVKAARGQLPVFLDGGVRRGTDVFKALALGAAGVFVSTPIRSTYRLVSSPLFGVPPLIGGRRRRCRSGGRWCSRWQRRARPGCPT